MRARWWKSRSIATRTVGSRAADFLLNHLQREGRLFRSTKDGRAEHGAVLEDYAFVMGGLLDLYEATGEPRWLDAVIRLDQDLAARFEDSQEGAYFLTATDHEQLLAREKPSYDGAEPCGNSVAILNLLPSPKDVPHRML